MPDNDEALTHLISFAREKLQSSDMEKQIDASTPLLELGILDSLKTAMLLSFISSEFRVVVPPAEINIDNFRDMRSLAALVVKIDATL